MCCLPNTRQRGRSHPQLLHNWSLLPYWPPSAVPGPLHMVARYVDLLLHFSLEAAPLEMFLGDKGGGELFSPKLFLP